MVQRLGDQGVSLQHRNKVLQYIPSYFQHVVSTTPPTLLKDFVQTVDQQADLQFRRMFYTDYSENDFTKKLQGGQLHQQANDATNEVWRHGHFVIGPALQ